MKNQNERRVWNERWRRQIALWQAELSDLLDLAETLMALIDLAIRRSSATLPSDRVGAGEVPQVHGSEILLLKAMGCSIPS